MNHQNQIFFQENVELQAIIEATRARSRDNPIAEEIANAEAIYLRPEAKFSRLVHLFGCTKTEEALFATVLAASFDPLLIQDFERVSGLDYVSEMLVEKLYGFQMAPISRSSSLLRWQLVNLEQQEKNYPTAFVLNDDIRSWLFGKITLDYNIEVALQKVTPTKHQYLWPDETIINQLRESLNASKPSLITLKGSTRCSKNVASIIAHALGYTVYFVDADDLDTDEILRLHRFSLLNNAAIMWSKARSDMIWPNAAWPTKLQFILCAEAPKNLHKFNHQLLNAPPLEPSERLALIKAILPNAWHVESDKVLRLSERPSLSEPAIRRAALLKPRDFHEFERHLRSWRNPELNGLGHIIDTSMTWDDLVLDARLKTRLKSLAFEINERKKLWQSPELLRLFSQEQTIVALFHGPSGLGKTLSAKVIANATGLDLLWADAASLTSKYIGDTTKNLRALFAHAERLNAIVFLDEADSLIGKRMEAKDATARYANADMGYFLQLIESGFHGTLILATNRKQDLDSAMDRRITHDFEFTLPAEGERRKLWGSIVAPFADHLPKTLSPDQISNGLSSFEMSPALMKSTMLAAYFLAAEKKSPITADVIGCAMIQSLEKQGGRLGERERRRIHKLLDGDYRDIS